MPKVTVFDQGGNEIEEMQLSADVFAVEVNPGLIHEAVKAQLEAKRLGTVSTKTRSEVKGGGRKPWRQKGTGRARHGSIRSPIWVGGGITFGPKPKDYRNRLPKKVKRQAIRAALTAKVEAGRLLILDNLELEKPKTKEMDALLKKLEINGEKVLILTGEKDDNIYKSARNIPGTKILIARALNIFDIVNNEYIIATKEAVSRMEEVYAS